MAGGTGANLGWGWSPPEAGKGLAVVAANAETSATWLAPMSAGCLGWTTPAAVDAATVVVAAPAATAASVAGPPAASQASAGAVGWATTVAGAVVATLAIAPAGAVEAGCGLENGFSAWGFTCGFFGGGAGGRGISLSGGGGGRGALLPAASCGGRSPTREASVGCCALLSLAVGGRSLLLDACPCWCALPAASDRGPLPVASAGSIYEGNSSGTAKPMHCTMNTMAARFCSGIVHPVPNIAQPWLRPALSPFVE